MWHLVICCSVIMISSTLGNHEVHTKLGSVKGKVWTSDGGRRFVGFTGIPYAKPPVGKLRFKEAVPLKAWSGVLDASHLNHNACPQTDYFAKNFTILGVEDCLYLNVYRPLVGGNYPVMFYIHGGSFLIGSGAPNWIGPEILMDKDIVLVVINYRLGALGFLSTENLEQPGNNGLKDQALAFKWVKENIECFGGNPSSITVFGNSAGGMAAQLFTMSPLTKGHITKAIFQSGTATTSYPTAKKGDAKSNAEKLGKFFNCSSSPTSDLINCLQEVDVLDIIKTEASATTDSKDSPLAPFQPVIEIQHAGAFLSEEPRELIMKKQFANIPILLGIVEQEGAYRSAEISVTPGLLQRLSNNFTAFVSENFPINQPILETSIAIREFYFGNKTIDRTTKSEVTNMFSDAWFLGPLDMTLYLLIKHKHTNQPIYLYLFGYHGSNSYSKLYRDLTFDYGVCHTDELLYLVTRRHIFPSYKPTQEDTNMAATLKDMWFDFAETSNPTPNSKTWCRLKNDKLQYLHIEGPNKLNMKEGLYASRRKFWRENVFRDVWNTVY